MVHSKSLIKHHSFVNTVLNMKMKKHQCIANFLIGFGSILNIAPVFATTELGSPKDDLENLQKDWQAIGADMYKAMERLNNGTSSTHRNK